MSETTVFESELNIGLSDLLRQKGLACSTPEKSVGRGKRHDIDIKIGVLNAVIEAEKGHTTVAFNNAFKEAAGRLKDHTADIAVALCYAPGSTRKNLKKQILKWAVIHPRNLTQKPNWAAGTLDDLVLVILQLPNEFGNPDALAQKINGALEMAVHRLREDAKVSLAWSLDLPRDQKSGWNTAATRALLVIATAMMFHVRLNGYLKSTIPKMDNRQNPPAPFVDEWPPQSVKECTDDEMSALAFTKAWRSILALDYRPIFETAYKALGNAPPSPSLNAAINIIAKEVLEIAGDAASVRHDLMGRIFHRILNTAKYDGSFYTSTAGATLLAMLALQETDADWKNAKSIGKLRIIDPACGTGTLLMAAAERVRDLNNRAGGLKELGNILIEKILHGYDTNLTATHLAATTLALLSPGTEFSRMNIERTFLGVDDKTGHASLGSLEFIPGGQPSLLGWARRTQHVDDEHARVAKVANFDLVIMNPPFTRSDLRHDQFSGKHEIALKSRERILLKKYLSHNGDKVLHMSSQGNNFVVLAEQLIRQDGTMAAILPMGTATNPSALGIRKFLAAKFHVDMIVVSHDPQRIMFSENTNISELLIICRKQKSTKPTQVITLAHNPKNPSAAMMIANVVLSGEKKDGIVKQKINHKQMLSGDWTPVQFLSARLVSLFDNIRGGEYFLSKPISCFGKMLNGVTARTHFVREYSAQKQGMIALWNHKTNVIKSMAATHDNYIVAKQGKTKEAEKSWNARARLMLPARLWLPLTRAPAVLLGRPAVGSAWYAFTFDGDDKKLREKALCLYLNSSMGILALMGVRDFKKLGYPNFSVDSISKLIVPDLDKLTSKKMSALAAAFDRYAKAEFLHFREMSACDTRRHIDNAIADAFGIPQEIMEEIRELLSREPSISGKRYEKLALS